MSRHLKGIPGIIFALLVILLALGNASVGFYPYGTAVWVRPMISLIGMAGAIMLLIGNEWWRVLLPLWCLVQCWVVASDPSGEWFFQGVWLGWKQSHSVRINNVLTEFHASGMNFAGLVLAGIVLLIMVLRLHPPIRWPITTCAMGRVGGIVVVVVLIALTASFVRKWQQRSAAFVLDVDLPAVPIYYRDKLLGRTPLAITPAKVKEWGLPLTDPEHLKVYSSGWADGEVLSDGQTDLPLYAGLPFGFTNYVDHFDSPWGQRVRMHLGAEHDNRREGYIYRKPELRDEPVLTIKLLNTGVIHAGDVLHLRCTLTNPTRRQYAGRKATIERHFFSFVTRHRTPTTYAVAPKREQEMPASWNNLPPGASYTADIDLDAPPTPDQYEWFCTWSLSDPRSNSNTLSGGCYSNILSINVAPRAASGPAGKGSP